ncbi:hypothetical protein E4191_20960 (plasmid) [Paracoccus liaowanqingii]|uniref:Exopolysaccharide Pel transporter PelG n=1 Tax=Paracoccus liaowanqingii TaxID=2560053 RepID=A0A4Y5SUZ8_9RHOB|nr:exopolysaccharide Pel transporter PelG [Paracoccus liaowanqingii]QDA36574.1 hypothetical protein E4191_20960 [Paracoccus liaowanqingii]
MAATARLGAHLRAILREARWVAGDPLLASVLRLGAAIIVAAGPWLVSVTALAIISVTMTPVMGFAAVEDLRLTVVYAFCIAPLAAGPIGAIAARRVSAALEAGRPATVAELFLSAAALSSAVAQIIAILACLILEIEPVGVAIGFVFLTGTAALLWTSFAVLAALRAFGFLIAAFTGGMALSVACALVAASRGPTTEILIWCLAAGLSLCVALSIRHVQRLCPSSYATLRATSLDLLAQLRAHAVLCAGVLFAICGVWIDKWVFWFGPDGVRSAAGYLHASGYDSVMFLAHLSVIPSYAALLIFHHGDLVAAIDRFHAALEDRATYALLQERLQDLVRTAWSGVFTIVVVQSAVTVGLVLMSPLLERSLDFSFDQFLMLRIGFIGCLGHAVMFLCCALLLVANRTAHFALIQGAFLVLNLGLSIGLSLVLGISAYAFFCSALIAGAVAFYAAYRALSDYDYHLFLAENDSLYAK